jgi:hypothetical protein
MMIYLSSISNETSAVVGFQTTTGLAFQSLTLLSEVNETISISCSTNGVFTTCNLNSSISLFYKTYTVFSCVFLVTSNASPNNNWMKVSLNSNSFDIDRTNNDFTYNFQVRGKKIYTK